MTTKFRIGDRVRFTTIVDHFPHGIVYPEATGVVTDLGGDGAAFLIRLDQHEEWLDEWENQVQLMEEYGEKPEDILTLEAAR